MVTILRMIHGAHYGSGVTNLDASDGIWKKVFGPWLLYVNESDSDDGLWADAKDKARQEIAAWPYSWMNHPDYPLAAERGTVGQHPLSLVFYDCNFRPKDWYAFLPGF